MVLTVVISFLLLCGTGSLAQSCTQPLSELRETIVGAFGTDYNVSINCMSFDSNGTLYRAIASGFSDSDANVRYVFSCTGGVIIAVQSNESVSTAQNGTCVHCEDAPQPCITSCPDRCERCYIRGTESILQCSVCTACVALRASSCTPAALMSSQPQSQCELSCSSSLHYERPESNNWCECKRLQLHNYPTDGPEGAHPEEPDIDIDEGADCVAQCGREHHRPTHSNEGNICFACGHEYCVTCNISTNHCETCLFGSELNEEDGECVTGDLAEVVRVAREQEEEVADEERRNNQTQVALAIALPIVCVAVIFFFTFMAIFAHFRYPHISFHGEKRHRQKPEVSPPPEHENIWRARPTIRLR